MAPMVVADFAREYIKIAFKVYDESADQAQNTYRRKSLGKGRRGNGIKKSFSCPMTLADDEQTRRHLNIADWVALADCKAPTRLSEWPGGPEWMRGKSLKAEHLHNICQ